MLVVFVFRLCLHQIVPQERDCWALQADGRAGGWGLAAHTPGVLFTLGGCLRNRKGSAWVLRGAGVLGQRSVLTAGVTCVVGVGREV